MSSKDAGLRIRVERDLREAFQGACVSENRNASEVLREFMQTYVERHQGGQGDLFSSSPRGQVHMKLKAGNVEGQGKEI